MRTPRALSLFVIVIGLMTTACRNRVDDIPQLAAKEYADTIDAFHVRRTNAIAGPEGWATHLGLWWLKPGVNRLGTDSSFAIPLPADRSPRVIGDILVEGDSARFVPARGVPIRVGKAPVTAPVTLHSD